MFSICLLTLISILSAVSAQVHQQIQMVPLKEVRHLAALQQPHLPQDHNVVAATQQFLHRFAQLKALADQAPDPPPRASNNVAVQHQSQGQGFTMQGLIGQHQQIHPQFQALPQQQIFFQHQQPQQQQQFHHQPQQQQQFNHQPQQQQQQFNHQPQAQQTHQQPQQFHHAGHPMVPVRNTQGILINPNRYPGPLAHSVPANVHVG